MMALYKSLVVPIAEYCCQLWNPAAIGLISDSFQRTFTSKITGVQHLDYWERLERLSLYSLQRRRERYIIIYTWKMVNGLVPNFNSDKFKIKTVGSGSRLGLRCLLPPVVRTGDGTLRDRSFQVMGPKLFNCIPIQLREFNGDLEGFKRRLTSFLATVEDKPPQPGYAVAAGGNSLLQQLAYRRAQNF